MKRDDFKYKIDLKPAINEENKRKNLRG